MNERDKSSRYASKFRSADAAAGTRPADRGDPLVFQLARVGTLCIIILSLGITRPVAVILYELLTKDEQLPVFLDYPTWPRVSRAAARPTNEGTNDGP
jgi:hypothetical protein